jgi:hypothetical protein
MTRSRLRVFGAIAAIALLAIAAACHRLVAPPGDTAVLVFPDRETADKVAQMARDKGMLGAIGSLGEGVKARPVLAGTAVKVMSSDDYSTEVIVTRGPYKGLHGYVLKTAVK